ncbi:hypothetical protein [Paenibacillus sp. FJAT-26967]|uniref:hypothetical protein n=1 Tax=Paenibacillus sp. FJAT-26967 TaxID=1729690 RepID=UPI0008382148|nr:hypothetical protein [Paenibacillus sp. FJAT-26967]
MAHIVLRPDLKTAGGEVTEILVDGRFAGIISLVYREGERMAGGIQLEDVELTPEDKHEVDIFMRDYIQWQVDALNIRECDIVLTYGSYDLIIGTPENDSDTEAAYTDDETELEWTRDDLEYEDYEQDGLEDLSMVEKDHAAAYDAEPDYELVLIEENRGRVRYQLFDPGSRLVAEASCRIYGTEAVCMLDWVFDPLEEEMELASNLIVADFQEEETENFLFHSRFDGEIVDTLEISLEEFDADELDAEGDEFSVILSRDDGDTLTYEIYDQEYGGLPVGIATIDVSEADCTGFIDFSQTDNSRERQVIAGLLMEELDKEQEYDSLHISMLYRNKLIDEIMFENIPVHH